MPKKMPKKLKKPSAATPHIPADIIIESILPVRMTVLLPVLSTVCS